MSVPPAISIVIRCRDEAPTVGPVIDAIDAQRGAPPFEVVVLDSGSRDGTLELLARRTVRVEHLPPDTFTYGHALNRGAALARGRLLVYLSAHCRPTGPDWLGLLVAPFADDGVVATLGGQEPIASMNPIEAITTRRNFPPIPPAAVRFSTANGAVRRAAVLARPFDEEIAIAEDHLWATGIAPEERIVYVPEATVTHSHPMSLRAWGARFRAHGLATAYARARLGHDLPWGEGEPGAAGRARAFVRLAATLAKQGEARALLRLPEYALARTVWYARGVQEGMRRYGTPKRPDRGSAR